MNNREKEKRAEELRHAEELKRMEKLKSPEVLKDIEEMIEKHKEYIKESPFFEVILTEKFGYAFLLYDDCNHGFDDSYQIENGKMLEHLIQQEKDLDKL